MDINIVTVVYNDVSGIGKTLESIRLNKEFVSRYIIIDGGSTDGTLDLIKNNDDIVDVIISESDNGIYDAMNKGLRYCEKNAWVLFLNSSDYLEAEAISNVKNAQYSNDIIHGMIKFVNNGNLIKVQGRSSSTLDSLMIEHPASFVHYRVFEKLNGFDTRYRSASDYDFMLRAREFGFSFQFIPIIVSNFDVNGISSSNILGAIESLEVRKQKKIISNLSYMVLKFNLLLKTKIKKFIL